MECGAPFGPLLPFERPLCVRACICRSGAAGGTRRSLAGAHAGTVGAARRLHCAARLEVAPRTRCAHFVRYAQTGGAKSVLDARCACRLQGCAARRPRNRPRQAPPGSVCRAASVWLCAAQEQDVQRARRDDRPGEVRWNAASCAPGLHRRSPWLARGRRCAQGPAGGDFCDGEERSPWVGARSAHPKLTSPRLFERSERSERSEFGAGPKGEHHSGVGAKRRPSQHEPPAGPCAQRLPRRSDRRTQGCTQGDGFLR